MICFQGAYSLIEKMVTENRQVLSTVSPHYLWIPCLRISSSLTFVYHPKIRACDAFMVIQTWADGQNIEVSFDVHVPCSGQTRQHSAFLYQLSYCTQCPFHSLWC